MSRRHARSATAAGFTLIEVMVAVAIVAMVGVMIYGAFQGMSRSRRNMQAVADRYQQGRAAVDRVARELSASFISAHLPPQQNLSTRQTAFIGSDAAPADRVDFTAFAHLRLRRDAHESDQAEISYFGSRDPDTNHLDLVRRMDKTVDDDPTRGGVVQVLAEDIDSFELAFLDPVTGEWLTSWDSTQPAAQLGRLPSQVAVTLVMADGPGGHTVTFQTKATIPIQLPLSFAIGN